MVGTLPVAPVQLPIFRNRTYIRFNQLDSSLGGLSFGYDETTQKYGYIAEVEGADTFFPFKSFSDMNIQYLGENTEGSKDCNTATFVNLPLSENPYVIVLNVGGKKTYSPISSVTNCTVINDYRIDDVNFILLKVTDVNEYFRLTFVNPTGSYVAYAYSVNYS